MTDATLAFNILTRYHDTGAKAATRDMDRLDKSSSHMTASLKKAGAVGAVALAAGVALAGRALVGMAKSAMEDQKAQALLAKQLKNSAGATKAQVAATEDWISKQGLALGITDDELRPALAKLTAVTKDVGKAQSLASLAMNVSAGTGKSLSTVSAALAKAQLGQVSGLSKLGVATKNADGSTRSLKDITADMAKTYAGSAATAANTAQGKFGRLKLMFDETKESIGAKLLPILSDMASWFLSKGLPAIQKFGGWLGDNLGPIIGDLVGWFKNDLLPALKDAWAKYLPALQKAFESVKKALHSAQPFFDLLGDVFVNVILPVLSKVASTALPLVGKALEVLGKALGLAAGIIKKVATAFLFLGEYGVKAFRLLLTAAFAVFGGILAAADKGLGWIPGIGDKIGDAKRAFDEFGDATVKKLKGVEDSLHRTRDAINAIKSKDVTINLHVNTSSVSGHYGSTVAGLDRTGRTMTMDPREAFGRSSVMKFQGYGEGLIESLRKGIEGKMPAISKVLDKVTDIAQHWGDRLKDLLSKRADIVGQFGDFTSSAFGATSTDAEGNTLAPTASSLIDFQKAELAKARRLRADVARLLKMGLSKNLIEQMAASGESGIAQIHALAGGTATDVQQLNSLNAATQSALSAAGMSAGNALYGDQIKQAQQNAALAQAIAKEIREALRKADEKKEIHIHLEGRELVYSINKYQSGRGKDRPFP